MARPHKLARARSRLQRYLSEGWQRAVFASPQTPDTPRREKVIDGPGAKPVDDDSFAELMQAAKEAARDGLVKQSYIIDDSRRIEIDARHGIPRERVRDAATIEKVMGGKRRALRPDRSEGLLRSIGIMNADGTISARHARKYKQVNHLVELCRPTWTKLLETRSHVKVDEDGAQADRPLHILDLACGNSYLCFILAEAFRLESIAARIVGVDIREDVVARSGARAEELGFDNLSFEQARIEDAGGQAISALDDRIDMMISLHACDSATDEALAMAIRRGVTSIFCVPCCQAELAREMLGQAASEGPDDPPTEPESSAETGNPGHQRNATNHHFPVAAIRRHGLLRRAYAETLTDALRVEILDACGYSVTLLEFVESEHSAKNLLIRAHRRAPNQAADPSYWKLDRVAADCEKLGITPRLLRMLRDTDATGA